jgi:hypothetical protein
MVKNCFLVGAFRQDTPRFCKFQPKFAPFTRHRKLPNSWDISFSDGTLFGAGGSRGGHLHLHSHGKRTGVGQVDQDLEHIDTGFIAPPA